MTTKFNIALQNLEVSFVASAEIITPCWVFSATPSHVEVSKNTTRSSSKLKVPDFSFPNQYNLAISQKCLRELPYER